MSNVETNFVLHGSLAGKTVELKTSSVVFPFVKGRLTIKCSIRDMTAYASFLARNWQAYPEGHVFESPELSDRTVLESMTKLPEEGDDDGERDIQESSEQDPDNPVQDPDLSDGEGTETGGEGEEGEGDAETETGEAGSVPGEDGQPEELNGRLTAAINSLDDTNDDHWTKDGKPAITAVVRAYGSGDVTRQAIKDASPRTRTAAK